MTEESILNAAVTRIDKLASILGNGLTYEDFLEEIRSTIKEAIDKARQEALRGN